jgi:hypothetical protein
VRRHGGTLDSQSWALKKRRGLLSSGLTVLIDLAVAVVQYFAKSRVKSEDKT